ncbi:hypothetical protein [Pararhodobacter aggregans]|uniref:hypothetical protein n=1 Tax=Pararhodobacter aggregans TaxID=404875 RepID=UPI003A9166D8
MTLATPARVTTAPSHAQAAGRASALWLFPAAVVCGLGLGLAALAALAPVPRAPPLPPVTARGIEAGSAPAVPEAGRDWAALFGRPPAAAPPALPQAPPAPPPEPAYDPADDFDPDLYVLRGLAVATDASEGFALLETPDGAMVLRQGSVLPEGHEILEITAEGIVIDVFGEDVVIGFQEDRPSVDGAVYDGDLRGRTEAPSDRADGLPPEREGTYEASPLDSLDLPPGSGSRRPGFPASGPSGSFGRDMFGLSR